MKIIQVSNWHRVRGGREMSVELTTRVIKQRGHEVLLITRDSQELCQGIVGRIRALTCGIYSASSRKAMAKLIREFKPDLIHVHGLYPFFSPWILVECRLAGVPVVMTFHEYRLTCPTSHHLLNNTVCELCVGGHEYWCVLKNCRNNIFESVAYALHNVIARKFRLFQDNVTVPIAYNEFARHQLIVAGFAEERIAILPIMVPMPDSPTDPAKGKYVAYVGRISPEKGIDTLLIAASRLPELYVQLAGEGQAMRELTTKAPENATFVGRLDGTRISEFYRDACFLVVPSNWFEVCPAVIAEAMSHGLPVITSRIGGLPEMVEDGVTGFLFEPGNSEDLAEKMKLLWENRDLCRQMGQAGREKALREYSEEIYCKRLMAIYERAIEVNKEQLSEKNEIICRDIQV